MAKPIYEVGYWHNSENIKNEIIKFNLRYKKGHEDEMPSHTELKYHDYTALSRAIIFHGGTIKIADMFGLKLDDKRRKISKKMKEWRK